MSKIDPATIPDRNFDALIARADLERARGAAVSAVVTLVCPKQSDVCTPVTPPSKSGMQFPA